MDKEPCLPGRGKANEKSQGVDRNQCHPDYRGLYCTRGHSTREPSKVRGLTVQDLLATLRILVLTVNEMGSFLPREEKVTVTF